MCIFKIYPTSPPRGWVGGSLMNKRQIIKYLREENAGDLFAEANRVREEYMGDAIHLRGLIEFSNICGCDCLYCGLRRSNVRIKRYRMDIEEIFQSIQAAYQLGYKSVVLQSGEHCEFSVMDLCSLLSRVKKNFDIAITLSIGEKTYEEYKILKESGADRYLLRFETSHEALFKKLKPDSSYEKRMECLKWLKDLNYQVGSGIMLGLPGQTDEMIADDILLMKQMDLDMIGIGPFIVNPHTPLENEKSGTLFLTLKTLALIRIVTKNTHIPATTAMGSIDPNGRQKALQCGANVLMPNVTPTKYREHYQLYPNKICISDSPSDCFGCISSMAASLGRTISSDHGHSLKKTVA